MSVTANQITKGKKPEKTGRIAPAKRGSAKGSGKSKRPRRNSNRQALKPSATVMVALDNPNGLRWILDYAPIYASILHGIEMGLTAQGKQMQVCSIRSPEEFKNVVQGRRPPDGLLFLASKNVISLQSSIGSIPCVSVLGTPCDGFFDRITYNQSATGRLPAEFFLQQGITTAAILGPTEPGRNTTFGDRFSSFCESMQDAGGTAVPLLSDQLYEPGNPSNQPRPGEIALLINRLQSITPLPKGLYVMADNFLPSVYKYLADAGIQPGKDLRVIGCNAESPYLAGIQPSPCMVDIPTEEIGLRSVELLHWRTQNPGRACSTTILQPSLKISEQCSFGS
jgi:DNA-binding LacI/PurR family transcriptional regulator